MNSEPSPKYSAFVRLTVLFHFEPIVPTFDVDYRSLEHVHESVFVWISHFTMMPPTFVHNFQIYSDGSNIFAIAKQERLMLFCFSLTLAGRYWMFLGDFECFYRFFPVLCVFVFLTLFISFYYFCLLAPFSRSMAFSIALCRSLSLSVTLCRFLLLSIVFRRFPLLSVALCRSLPRSVALHLSPLSTALRRSLPPSFSFYPLCSFSISISISFPFPPTHRRIFFDTH